MGKIIVRTGVRTIRGAIEDGINSIIRYFNNNFCDGYYDDCLNLAFNQVEISEESDRLVVREKESSFVFFDCML